MFRLWGLFWKPVHGCGPAQKGLHIPVFKLLNNYLECSFGFPRAFPVPTARDNVLPAVVFGAASLDWFLPWRRGWSVHGADHRATNLGRRTFLGGRGQFDIALFIFTNSYKVKISQEFERETLVLVKLLNLRYILNKINSLISTIKMVLNLIPTNSNMPSF